MASTMRVSTPVLPMAVKSRIISSSHFGPMGSARSPGVRSATSSHSSNAGVLPRPTALASVPKAKSIAAAAMTPISVTRSARLT